MSVLSVSDVYPPTDPIRSDGEVMEMMRLLAGTETDQVGVCVTVWCQFRFLHFQDAGGQSQRP